jgi:2-C-methyl-D-erythritol 2,4-cyclodiphosphate synthase
MEMRIGHGYDLHRLEASEQDGEMLKVGGIGVKCGLKAIAHSDGDAVMHALADALLSAIGEPDIGQLFPDTATENKNRDSAEFLVEAIERINLGGWAIGNVAITVICDQPKIAPHREQICESLRRYIVAPIHIKGKTCEGTDKSGAMEVHVVTLVQRGNTHE